MPSNIFDQFDNKGTSPSQSNPFNQFDQTSLHQGTNNITGGESQGTFWDNIDILNRNFASIANGGLQATAQGLQAIGIDTSKFQNTLATQQAIHERDYKQALQNSPISGTITDIGSKIGAAVATPGTQPLLAMKGLDVTGRIAQTSGASALTGSEEYVPEGGSRADNAIQSGFIGGALQGTGELIGVGVKSVVPKLFNTPVQEAADSANQGLLTTMGSATGNPALQGAEDVLGRIPVLGAKRGIAKQVGKLQQETSGVLNDIGVGAQSKVDLGSELSTAIKSSYNKASENTNKAYADAIDIASKNKISIPLQETQSVAQKALDQIEELKQSGVSSADISGTKVGKLIQDIADIPSGQIPAKSFDMLRRKIGAIRLTDDSEGLSPILKQIKSSMDTDLESAGGINKTFGDALLKARNIYQTEKAPFKNVDVLDKALTGKIDTDQLLNTIVKSDRPVLTSNVMNALSPEGKQAFSKAIINKTVKDSIGADDVLDLGKFNNQLHKLGETISALPEIEQMKIQGLQKLLMRADSMIKTNKLSANSLGNWLGSTGAGVAGLAAYGLGGIGQLLGAGAFTKGLSWAMTSPKLTRGLIKLAGGKMAETAQDGIVKAALKTMIKKGSIPAAATSIQFKPKDENQAVQALGISG